MVATESTTRVRWIISTLLTPVLKNHFGWSGSLTIGALLSVVSGIIWLWIRADRPYSKNAELLA